ncbi:Extracellular superoxide dismutase [Cu-Zn] [Toxocara canis]|uniref:Extracellular superoxide dismutase [Cu-Zn] n=1 Tax=Toxocara canis TaxID=6265 RepID=A0A0B2VZD5_TOXCA|nr:Extracellular superoxide dismutase [Cu-Zn] [Toxocara canis]
MRSFEALWRLHVMKQLVCFLGYLIFIGARNAGALDARAYVMKAGVGPAYENLGIIDFSQKDGFFTLNGWVKGLSVGFHGFHIHSNGDFGVNCSNSGGNYTPLKGGRNDLGSIQTLPSGVAKISSQCSSMALQEIVGRSVVIHEADGTHHPEEEGKNIDDWTRVACGVIGVVS